MGLFSFIKDAGEAVFGDDEKDKEEQQKQELALAQARRKAVKARLKAAELKTDGVEVDVQDDKVVLKGKVANRADREKVVLMAGNTLGVSAVEEALEVDDDSGPEAALYTVKSGDTLSKIAKAQYGDAGKYGHIFEANKPMLSNPDKIYVGQTLRIPPLS